MAGEAAERVQSFSEDAADALSVTGRRAAELAGEAQARATGVAGDLKDRAAETTDKVKAGIEAASETAQGTMERVRSTARDRATAAPETVVPLDGEVMEIAGGVESGEAPLELARTIWFTETGAMARAPRAAGRVTAFV